MMQPKSASAQTNAKNISCLELQKMSDRAFGNDLIRPRLPAELVRHIYEFDGTFRDDYSKCMDKIAVDGIHSRLTCLARNFETGVGDAYATTLLEHFPDSNNVIKTLNKCKCCPAHQFRKPKSLTDLNGTRRFWEYPHEDWTQRPCKNGCLCNCRNISRWLCRANGTLDLN